MPNVFFCFVYSIIKKTKILINSIGNAVVYWFFFFPALANSAVSIFPPHFPFLGFQMGLQKMDLKNIFIRSSIRSFSCYINECANYANLLIAHRARIKGGRKRHIYIGSPFNFILRSVNRLNFRKSSMVYFLVACTRLYKPLCRSVGRSVCRSVRRWRLGARDLWRSALLPLMVDFFQAQFCNLAPFYWTYSSPRFGAWRVWKLPWWIWWAQG